MKKILMTAAFAIAAMTSTGVMAAERSTACDNAWIGKTTPGAVKKAVDECLKAQMAAAVTPEAKAAVPTCDATCQSDCDGVALDLAKGKPSGVVGYLGVCLTGQMTAAKMKEKPASADMMVMQNKTAAPAA